MIYQSSTILLRATLIVMALIVILFAAFAFPAGYHGAILEFPYASQAILGIFAVLYIVCLPYLYVLLQSWRILNLIDNNQGFSEGAIKAFRAIKIASYIGTGLLSLGFVPLLYPIAEQDDAPGLLIYGALFAGIPFVVATFAAVMEKLFRKAFEIKSENDLTI